MKYSVFKEKVENLKIPWAVNPGCIYCPLYMKSNQGYVIQGKTFIDDEDYLDDIFTNIINLNRTTIIEEDVIKLRIDNGEYISIIRNQ